MIDWIKTAQGAAIVVAIFATMVAWWNLGLPHLVFSPAAPDRGARAVQPRYTAPSQLADRGVSEPGSIRTWSSTDPLGMLWPKMDAAFVASGAGNGRPPTAARRPVVPILAG